MSDTLAGVTGLHVDVRLPADGLQGPRDTLSNAGRGSCRLPERAANQPI
jgi:hypothetical protein